MKGKEKAEMRWTNTEKDGVTEATWAFFFCSFAILLLHDHLPSCHHEELPLVALQQLWLRHYTVLFSKLMCVALKYLIKLSEWPRASLKFWLRATVLTPVTFIFTTPSDTCPSLYDMVSGSCCALQDPRSLVLSDFKCETKRIYTNKIETKRRPTRNKQVSVLHLVKHARMNKQILTHRDTCICLWQGLLM